MISPPLNTTSERHVSFAVLSAASFMFGLDTSIVNVGIPSIEANLHATFSAIQLVVAGYQLAFACTLITAARLGDMFGRKRLFLSGLFGFTLMSAISGAAPNSSVLILARIGQGISAGMATPQIYSTIQVLFDTEERGKIFGIFGSVGSTATVVAPVLAGVLIGWNLHALDWRLIFYVNVPIGLILLPIAYVKLVESRSPHPERLDLPGAVVVAAALFMLIYPLAEGRQLDWPWWSVACLAASLPLFTIFIHHETTRTSRDDSPLVYMDLFKDRVFRVSVLLVIVFFTGTFSWFFTVAIYMQLGFGFSALHSGLTTFPFSVASGFLSFKSARVARRLGPSVLRLAAGLLVLAMILMALTVRFTGAAMTSFDLIPTIVLAGAGLGLYIAPLNTIVLSGVRSRHVGSASGVLSTAIQIGASLGVAIAGLILFSLVGMNGQGSARAAFPAVALTIHAQPVNHSGALADPKFTDCFANAVQMPDLAQATLMCGNSHQLTSSTSSKSTELALRYDFATSFSEMLMYQVFVFTIVFLLTFALSRALRANAERLVDR